LTLKLYSFFSAIECTVFFFCAISISFKNMAKYYKITGLFDPVKIQRELLRIIFIEI
jgi:hypothetical protein